MLPSHMDVGVTQLAMQPLDGATQSQIGLAQTSTFPLSAASECFEVIKMKYAMKTSDPWHM